MASQISSRVVYIPVPDAAVEFSKNALKLLESKELCDAKLMAEKIPIDCHAVVIAASSDKLEIELEKSDTIELPAGLKYEDAKLLVQFCYSGQFPDDFETAKRILPFAKTLQIDEAVKLLVDIIVSKLDPSNVFEMRAFGKKLGVDQLDKAAYAYINRELDLIEEKNTEGFQALTYAEMLEIISDDDTVLIESKLFDCLLSWLCYKEERMANCAELLKHVRYISLMPDYVENMKTNPAMEKCEELKKFRDEVIKYIDMEFDEREQVKNSHTKYRNPELINLHETVN